MKKENRLRYLDLETIADNPFELRELSRSNVLRTSIPENGVLQPIMVRPIKRKGRTKWQVVCGQGRVDIARKAKLGTIPVIIRECDENEALRLSVVENLHRDDLDLMEEAHVFAELANRGCSQRKIQKLLEGKKSLGTINNRITLWKLFSRLSPKAQKAIRDGKYSTWAVSYVLDNFRDVEGNSDVDYAASFINDAVDKKLSVKDTVVVVAGLLPSHDLHLKVKAFQKAFPDRAYAPISGGRAAVPIDKPPKYLSIHKSQTCGFVSDVEVTKKDGHVIASIGIAHTKIIIEDPSSDLETWIHKAERGLKASSTGKQPPDQVLLTLQLESALTRKPVNKPVIDA